MCAIVLLLAPASLSGQDADAARIAEILSGLPEAWNARDADAWVAHFAEDSGFTNILGMHFDNRDENRERHAYLFGSIFRNSVLEAEVLDVRMLGTDAAVTDLAFTLTGYERLPPGIGETEPGVLRTRLLTVFEKRNGVWWIVAAQNTARLPTP